MNITTFHSTDKGMKGGFFALSRQQPIKPNVHSRKGVVTYTSFTAISLTI